MVMELVKQHSVASHFLAELRDLDVQKDPMRFRRNLERIGEVLALELSRTLDYVEHEVTTPLGMARTQRLVEQPVLATILRAGLPLHQGLLNYFDRADNAFVSAYRNPRDVTSELPTWDGEPCAYGARTLMSETPALISAETAPRSAWAALATAVVALKAWMSRKVASFPALCRAFSAALVLSQVAIP